MKATKLALIILMLCNLRISAQDKPTFAIPGMGSIEGNYQYSTLEQNGRRVNINQFGTMVTVPVLNRFKNGEHNFILVGAGYNSVVLTGTNSQFGEKNFHSISLPVTVQKALSKRYALVASFIPTIASDFKDISGEDIQYAGALMLKIRNSEKFNYLLGAFFARQFYGTVLVPVVAIDWKPSTKLSITGLLPVAAKVSYQTSAKSAFGALADLNFGGNSYRLSEDLNSEYFHLTQLKGALFYQYAFSKRLSMEANVGYNFTQELNRYAKGEKVNWIPFNDSSERTPLAEIKKAGPSGQLGIKYTF